MKATTLCAIALFANIASAGATDSWTNRVHGLHKAFHDRLSGIHSSNRHGLLLVPVTEKLLDLQLNVSAGSEDDPEPDLVPALAQTFLLTNTTERATMVVIWYESSAQAAKAYALSKAMMPVQPPSRLADIGDEAVHFSLPGSNRGGSLFILRDTTFIQINTEGIDTARALALTVDSALKASVEADIQASDTD